MAEACKQQCEIKGYGELVCVFRGFNGKRANDLINEDFHGIGKSHVKKTMGQATVSFD